MFKMKKVDINQVNFKDKVDLNSILSKAPVLSQETPNEKEKEEKFNYLLEVILLLSILIIPIIVGKLIFYYLDYDNPYIFVRMDFITKILEKVSYAGSFFYGLKAIFLSKEKFKLLPEKSHISYLNIGVYSLTSLVLFMFPALFEMAK